MPLTQYQTRLRASAWETEAVLEIKVGRFRLKLVHNLVIWTYVICQSIVYIGDWLWSPANIKGANKDGKIYVGRSTTVHNPLFCPHTLCMNYVTNTFLLVSFSERSKQLLYFVHRQGQKSEQKHKTKNFVEFHNHSPLLTMLKGSWTIKSYLKRPSLGRHVYMLTHQWKISLEPELTLSWFIYNCAKILGFPLSLLGCECLLNREVDCTGNGTTVPTLVSTSAFDFTNQNRNRT